MREASEEDIWLLPFPWFDKMAVRSLWSVLDIVILMGCCCSVQKRMQKVLSSLYMWFRDVLGRLLSITMMRCLPLRVLHFSRNILPRATSPMHFHCDMSQLTCTCAS
jgi:hypothetical protein